ncbi:hypothetical protein GT348_02665 [Aristophania vespae]|uniref:Uncharacterized protein n=1 Tax=Aristophania vespae TaxID=2697033 RepID=A0A6P1NCV7_9PROT|nr:hypothetical protein [Aristophania vespae]QHI95323.1 hypothetical protein GT348_02665 [Aristophania vespae]UMM64580.1 hypothetical protein DM15PD_15960 [Aristophania vespae]
MQRSSKLVFTFLGLIIIAGLGGAAAYLGTARPPAPTMTHHVLAKPHQSSTPSGLPDLPFPKP